jgi:hypothetical protein
MTVKIHNIADNQTLTPYQMRDGQIGILVDQPSLSETEVIVQRHGDDLILLGRHSERTLKGFCKYENSSSRNIRPLPNGTTIQIVNNE